MPTYTVTQPDGSTLEVDSAQVTPPDGHQLFELTGENGTPKGYVSEAARNQAVQAEAEKARKLKNPADLIDDPAHQRRVLQRLGIALGDDGKPKTGLDEAVRQKLGRIDQLESRNASLEADAKRTQEQMQATRKATRRTGLLAALQDAGLKAEHLNPLIPGGTPQILGESETLFAWDDTHAADVWKAAGLVRFKPDGTTPADYADYAAWLKGERPGLFEDRRQRGPGLTPKGPAREETREDRIKRVRERSRRV